MVHFHPLRSEGATAKSVAGQEHQTGLSTAAKGPVTSGASKSHSGRLRPLDRERRTEPLVTPLQAQGHDALQTQELGSAWAPALVPEMPAAEKGAAFCGAAAGRRSVGASLPVTRNATLTSVKYFVPACAAAQATEGFYSPFSAFSRGLRRLLWAAGQLAPSLPPHALHPT